MCCNRLGKPPFGARKSVSDARLACSSGLFPLCPSSTKSEAVLCIENAVTANVSWVSTPTALGRQERHAFRVARLIHLTRICSAYLVALLHAP